MSSSFALSAPTAEQDPAGHWLRLSLPKEWRRSAEGEGEESHAGRQARLALTVRDLRQFLLAYSAALVATITFIA